MVWHELCELWGHRGGGAAGSRRPGDLPLALYKVEGAVYCCGKRICTHAEAFLSDGYLDGLRDRNAAARRRGSTSGTGARCASRGDRDIATLPGENRRWRGVRRHNVSIKLRIARRSCQGAPRYKKILQRR